MVRPRFPVKDSLSIGSKFIGPHAWRGPRVAIADLPTLSHYVRRALHAEFHPPTPESSCAVQGLEQLAASALDRGASQRFTAIVNGGGHR